MPSLEEKTAVVVGVGALGTVSSALLVKAGIGRIRLVDRDFVEMSNLQRQMLFTEEDSKNDVPKVYAAQTKLSKMNPDVAIEPYMEDANALSIDRFVKDTDIIIDGTDNFETRYLLNDASVKWQIPWVYGGGIQARGMTATFVPGKTPCLRCLFPEPSSQQGQTCDTVGVLGPVLHIVASHQVSQAIDLLQNRKISLFLRQFDLWYNDIDDMPLEQSHNPYCVCCQKKHFEFLDITQTETMMTQLCGRNSVQITPTRQQTIHFDEWVEKWAHLGHTELTPFLLRLYYKDYVCVLFQDGRLMVQGTDDIQIARKLYRQLVG